MTSSTHLQEGRHLKHDEYQVVQYYPELKSQVLDVLQHLWKGNPAEHASHFDWKYTTNPHVSSPLAIVALNGSQVLGFRGYFPVRFKIDGRTDTIIVLIPGDTCVHPHHRRKGLSVAMNNLASKEYAPKYPLYLSLSCNNKSLPGNMKMGFLPLKKKIYMTHYSLSGFIKYSLAKRKGQELPLEASPITFGRFGSFMVSHRPLPEQMAAVIAAQGTIGSNFSLLQDTRYFEWRFNSRKHKYVFYYLMKDEVMRGYIVMGVSLCNIRGYILDYAQGDNLAIKELLGCIIHAKHFDIISIYSYAVDSDLGTILSDLRFTLHSPIRFLARNLHGELPLLVRPIKKKVSESDFYIGGLDVRKIENWSLKPICSDAA